MSLEAIAALLGHRSMRMTMVYARIANRTVAEEYFAVSEKVEALYDAPKNLPADAEGAEMRKLRAEMHQRMLGNGYCARPVGLDCHFESICESCTFFQTTIEFRPTLTTPARRRRRQGPGRAPEDLRRAAVPPRRGSLLDMITLDKITRIMAEQGHQCLQRHAGVDQGGGIGVPELVRGHVAEPGGLPRRPVEFFAEGVLGQPPAVVGEQELGGAAVSRVRQRPARGAELGDLVDQGEGLLVEGDHPLGVELAERDFQPGALSRGLRARSRARGRAARRCAARRRAGAAARQAASSYG